MNCILFVLLIEVNLMFNCEKFFKKNLFEMYFRLLGLSLGGNFLCFNLFLVVVFYKINFFLLIVMMLFCLGFVVVIEMVGNIMVYLMFLFELYLYILFWYI